MLKRTLLVVLVVFLAGSAGLFIWARSVLTQDSVRTALAARLSQALGQPVAIGAIGASIYPRVTVSLEHLTIGQPARINVNALGIGTDFRALLSRRIEHASLRLTGARIELPLPDFAVGSRSAATPGTPSSSAPVELGSIDEIVLNGVEIVSGGRVLRGDVDLVPHDKGVTIRKVTIGAGSANINITGQIDDLAGPTGELAIKAGVLDIDQLLAFVTDFSKGLPTTASTTSQTTSQTASQTTAVPMSVALAIDADRATIGTLALQKLSGRARITPNTVILEPIAFGVFDGRYDGTLALSAGGTPDFRLKAALSGIDMAAMTKYAGSPNVITGKLAGNLELAGRGVDASTVLKSARGTARIDVTNGVVRNLGLIQAAVVATSMRSDAASPGGGSKDEPFTRLGGTLALANGEARTENLRFESKDLTLAAAGAMRLDGSAIDLKGQAQLSDALSKQAGRDLVRYTQDQGRVTLPATITGSAEKPQVRIDVGDMATRAVRNKANEEAQKAITKGLGKFLGKR